MTKLLKNDRRLRAEDGEFMRSAIREARKNLKTIEGGPFGACIVLEGRILAVSRNTVLRHDATCHAEVNAIRKASKILETFDLSGCRIFSTTEPCPMCFSAIHWSRIEEIVYGTGIADARKAGFRELEISNASLKALGKSRIRIRSGFLKDECAGLFEDWIRLPGRKSY